MEEEKMTFENFIIRESNELAVLAVDALSRDKGKKYSPLVIEGKNGVGKTHLVTALINSLDSNNNIIYTTSEKFIAEYINFLKDNTHYEFLNKYSELDLLVIENIEFMSGKMYLNSILCNLINTLLEHQAKVIVTTRKK